LGALAAALEECKAALADANTRAAASEAKAAELAENWEKAAVAAVKAVAELRDTREAKRNAEHKQAFYVLALMLCVAVLAALLWSGVLHVNPGIGMKGVVSSAAAGEFEPHRESIIHREL